MSDQDMRRGNRQPNQKTSATPSKKKARKPKKSRGKLWFYLVFFAIVFGIVAAVVGYSAIIINGERLLAEHGDKLEFGEASTIYDENGVEIAKLYDVNENREIAEFNEIPQIVLDAFVATEDKRFYEHGGLDFISIGRALVKDIIARSAVEGGSTITQQLAKNVFLSADKTVLRKATEASIAVALENEMTKEQILTMYLNRIYYGRGIHGIKGAAEYYFDKDISELELWEAATLAAMPKAPNRYNPVNNPEASMERRAVVLQLMYDQGIITLEEMEAAKKVEYVQPNNKEKFSNSQYTAFIDFVIEEAIEKTNLSEEELRVGGFDIYTTLNASAQDVMDKHFDDDSNFEESVDDELAQGAMVIIDQHTGELKAMSAGRDYVKKGWNRVTKPRQPGSAYKPIISFGPALETGEYKPSTILDIDKKCFGDYCPSDKWGATPVAMETALQESRNLAAVWLLNQIGFKRANEFATKLGVGLSESEYYLASALGGLERGFSPLQMATAYSVIANDGNSVDVHTIRSIEGKNFKYKYEAPKKERLMSESTAAYLTQMLQKVVESGTGKRAQIDRPVAGKTGTTQHGIPNHKGSENRDVWFVGYTPEWTAAVWMGYDNTDKNHLLKKGSSQAATLFAKVMKEALATIPKGSFDTVVEQEEVLPELVMGPLQLEYIDESMMVSLTWSIEYEGDVTFEVFRMEQNSGSFVHFAETEGELRIDDSSVFPANNYQYYVIAHDLENGISSEPSNIVSVDIPDTDIPNSDFPMENIEEDINDLIEGNPYETAEPTSPVEQEPTQAPNNEQAPTAPADGGGSPTENPPTNEGEQPSTSNPDEIIQNLIDEITGSAGGGNNATP